MSDHLAVVACKKCGLRWIERRGFCPHCGSRDVAPGTIAAVGTLWSVTEIHRPPTVDGDNEPYRIGIVALEAGIKVMVRLDGNAVIDDPILLHDKEPGHFVGRHSL